MTTGQRIKAARKKAGMTQSELARKLGIPYQSIGQWENDQRNPKIETLERISTALGIHTLDLLGIGEGQLDIYVQKTDDIVFPTEIPISMRNDIEQIISKMSAAEMFNCLSNEKKQEFVDMLNAMTATTLTLSKMEKNLVVAYRAASADDRAIIDNIVQRYSVDTKKQNLA